MNSSRLSSILIICGLVVAILIFGFLLFPKNNVNSSVDPQRLQEVVIYTYDSFTSEWGAAPQLIKDFEAQTGLKCTMLTVGDGVQILSKAVLEKDAPQADVLLGVDNNMMDKVVAAEVLEPYKPEHADTCVPEELRLTEDWLVTPYDWSYFAMIHNSTSNTPAPTCLEDLTKSEYNKKIILMAPRTSTPGLGFVAWTVAVFGDKYLDYWKALKPNILTMAPSWSTGYGLFTEGEAPLVVSYTTSPAYHVEYEEGDHNKALIFPEGHVMQIEAAGLVKNAPNPQGGKLFLDFLISQQAQNVLPLTQWMYPVNPAVTMPASYDVALKASKTLSVDNATLSEAVENIMNLLAL